MIIGSNCLASDTVGRSVVFNDFFWQVGIKIIKIGIFYQCGVNSDLILDRRKCSNIDNQNVAGLCFLKDSSFYDNENDIF